jgi:hypothetical protein
MLLIDLRADVPLHTWHHPRWIRSASISADGSRAASGSADGLLRIFDTQSRDEIMRFELKREIYCSGFAPDRRWIAVGTASVLSSLPAVVVVYDLESQQLHQRLEFGGLVRYCGFSPSGEFLVVCAGHYAFLYETESWTCVCKLHHPAEVWSCDISIPHRAVITCSQDGLVRLYRWQQAPSEIGGEKPPPPDRTWPQRAWPWTCKFLDSGKPDELLFAVGGDDSCIRVVEEQDNEERLTIVAAFPLPHGRTADGMFSLPRAGDYSQFDVKCERGVYPLDMVASVLDPDPIGADATLGVPGRLERDFPEVRIPQGWRRDG